MTLSIVPFRKSVDHTSSEALLLAMTADKSPDPNLPLEGLTKVNGTRDPLDVRALLAFASESFATGEPGTKYDTPPMTKVVPAEVTCAWAQ